MSVVSKLLIGSVGLALLGTAGSLQARDTMMAPADPMMAPAGSTAPRSFRRAEAPVSGSVLIRQQSGKRLLVLSSDFRTKDTAPDLKVVFSPSTTPLASSKAPAYPLRPGTYTVLAPLKSADGAQSYVIPASIDLAKQGSVLIWCQQFNATMAWAPLRP